MNQHQAEAVARVAHKDQLYGQRPYVDAHVAPVVAKVLAMGGSEDQVVIAWLHDVLEDTRWSPSDVPLLQLTRPQHAGLMSITHRQGEVYEAYIERVAQDPVARLVKLCDLQVNLENEPSEHLRPRYVKALARIREAMDNSPAPRGCTRETATAAAECDAHFRREGSWVNLEQRAGAVLTWCQANGWHFHGKLSAYLLQRAMAQMPYWAQGPSNYFDMARALNTVLLEL